MPDPTGDTPEFSGPWAQEFAQAYRSAQSDFARQVLSKETITDADLAEAQEIDKQCLQAAGLLNIVHHPQGGMDFNAPEGMSQDEAIQAGQKCSNESGLTQIEMLYSGLLINPNNEDMDMLTVQCLIDQKIVEASFTVEDLQAWYTNKDPHLANGSPGANCAADPLRRTGNW